MQDEGLPIFISIVVAAVLLVVGVIAAAIIGAIFVSSMG